MSMWLEFDKNLNIFSALISPNCPVLPGRPYVEDDCSRRPARAKCVAMPKRAKLCQTEALYRHLRRQRLAKWLLSSFVDVCWLLTAFTDALPTPYRRLCPVSGSSLWAPLFNASPTTAASWIRICKQPIVAKIASVYDFNKISTERGRTSLVALHVET